MSAQIEQNPFAKCDKFADKLIHLCVTGSVACYKSLDLLRAFRRNNIRVSATLSAGARQFLKPMLFKSLGAEPVYGEMFEDENVFAHLEPGQKADALLAAPASANALAKLAAGLADDMFSAQALAFAGPKAMAPAMNPRMWNNAATQANVECLRKRGWALARPGLGDTACGETGRGRLAELPEIYLAALKLLSPQDMECLKVMVTLGPTREPWDGARFWSNPSSGRMGAALATCAWLRGAEVTAICGPAPNIYLPEAIKQIHINTARELLEEAEKIWPLMNMGIFSAAVSDFAPKRPPQGDGVKLKKSAHPEKIEIEFHTNPDILATLSNKRSNHQKVLGFAAEITPDMQSLLPLANLKLNSKKADVIAANRVNPGESAFGADMDSMAVADRTGREEIWQAQNKADVAWELCTWLLRI